VLGFHGTPASSLMLRFLDAAATRLGIRLIAPDRPGFGGSSPRSERRLLDWPDDVTRLLDDLGHERVSVIGISGGGPYALATGWALPERVSALVVVSGMGPVAGPDATPDLPGRYQRLVRFGDRALKAARAVFAVEGLAWRHLPRLVYARMLAASPPVDRHALRKSGVGARVRDAIRDGFRQGGRASADEFVLLSRPWGFPLAEVRCPVILWHGEQDRLTPIPMARHMAARLPDCRPRIRSDAGHFFAFAEPDAILASLPAAG
jgi:pimeloyl-ACP methyl ester carboxylesterase